MAADNSAASRRKGGAVSQQGQSLGAAGQRRSFIEECWRIADPTGVGQRRGSGASQPFTAARETSSAEQSPVTPIRSEPADPVLPQEARGNSHSIKQAPSFSMARGPEGTGERVMPDASTPPDESSFDDDAMYVLQERLGVASELGMDAALGSPAWQEAYAEAHRSSGNQNRGDQ